jgi:hypothetical protein
MQVDLVALCTIRPYELVLVNDRKKTKVSGSQETEET